MGESSVGKAVNRNLRKYDRVSSVVFFKTKEQFGGLSNMAGGYPLRVNSIDIRSSEALYQACRFPHRSDLQSLVIDQKSPMTAKMKTKPYRNLTRPDWIQVRVDIMRWCLKVKLAQNWPKFSNLLLETGDRAIVEQSRKDDFWGAIPDTHEGLLVGRNALGRLLMELREAITNSIAPDDFLIVEPLSIPDFELYNRTIEQVAGRTSTIKETVGDDQEPVVEARDERAEQLGFNLNTPRSGPIPQVTQVRELTELSRSGQDKSNIRPYPDYKDSGVEWLGMIPEHWNVIRGKWLLNCIDVRSTSGDEELLTVSSERGVIPRSDATVTMFKAESYKGYKLCWPGDLVINSLWAWARGLGVSQHHGIVSSAYGVYRLKEPYHDYTGYLHRLVRSLPFNYELQVRSKGIWVSRLQLTDEAFLGAPIPLPDRRELLAIVRFLSHTNRCIQRYIRAKHKLLTLLEEQKQAIIHEAVTGQIEVRTGKPYSTYKLSGVEWLRDVPEHWEVLPNRELFVESKEREHTEETLLSVTIKDGVIHQRDFLAGSIKRDTSNQDKSAYKLVRPGDIAYNKMRAWQGAFGVSEYQGIVSPAYVVVRPRKGINSRYLHYLLRTPAFATEAERWSYGITSDMWSLRPEHFKLIYGCVPSLPEQTNIVRFLDDTTANLDKAVARTHHQIDLIQEYRARLVSDVVTGKLDVRKLAANLPQETDLMDNPSETGSINDAVSQVAG